jgi:hypothetical protein
LQQCSVLRQFLEDYPRNGGFQLAALPCVLAPPHHSALLDAKKSIVDRDRIIG